MEPEWMKILVEMTVPADKRETHRPASALVMFVRDVVSRMERSETQEYPHGTKTLRSNQVLALAIECWRHLSGNPFSSEYEPMG